MLYQCQSCSVLVWLRRHLCDGSVWPIPNFRIQFFCLYTLSKGSNSYGRLPQIFATLPTVYFGLTDCTDPVGTNFGDNTQINSSDWTVLHWVDTKSDSWIWLEKRRLGGTAEEILTTVAQDAGSILSHACAKFSALFGRLNLPFGALNLYSCHNCILVLNIITLATYICYLYNSTCALCIPCCSRRGVLFGVRKHPHWSV